MGGTTILAYIVISLSVVYAFTLPFFNNLNALLDEKSRYEEVLEKARNIEEKKNALLAEFNKVSALEIQKVETFIPSSFNFVKLAADIDAVAARYGISVQSIASIDGSNTDTSIAEAESTPTYGSAIITLSFSASYPNFQKFLEDLEKSLQILDIKSLTISPGDNNVYKYSMELETYWSQ